MAPPASAEYGSTFTVAASGLGTGAITYTSDGIVCTNSGATYTMIAGSGTCVVTASQAADTNYQTASTSANVTAADANTSVSVALTNGANPSAYGQSLTFTATLTSDTGLVRRRNTHKKPLDFSGNVTWSANTGCAASSVSGYPATATCTTTTLAGGSETVTATFAGDANHTGASGSVTQTVNPLSQTITLTTKPPVNAIYGTSFTVAATASSGLTPAFTTGATSGCSVVDNLNGTATYKMTSGTTACSVIVNQAGNVDYTAAPQVTKSVTAAKATQTITVNTAAPASEPDGETFTIAGTASSGLTVTYGSAGACTVVSSGPSGGTYKITAKTGTCFESMNQAGNSNYYAAPTIAQSTSVAPPVAPVVSFTGAPSSAVKGTMFQVTASSNETGNVTSTAVIKATTPGTCSLSNASTSGTTATATVTILTGNGTCTMTATWAANGAYKAATATQKTSAIK
jgi:hypothetical protein